MPIIDVDVAAEPDSHACTGGANDAASCPGVGGPAYPGEMRRSVGAEVVPRRHHASVTPLTLVRPLVEGFPIDPHRRGSGLSRPRTPSVETSST